MQEWREGQKKRGLEGSLGSSFLNKGKEWERKASSGKHFCGSHLIILAWRLQLPFIYPWFWICFWNTSVLRPHGSPGSFELQRKCSFVQAPPCIFPSKPRVGSWLRVCRFGIFFPFIVLNTRNSPADQGKYRIWGRGRSTQGYYTVATAQSVQIPEWEAGFLPALGEELEEVICCMEG